MRFGLVQYKVLDLSLPVSSPQGNLSVAQPTYIHAKVGMFFVWMPVDKQMGPMAVWRRGSPVLKQRLLLQRLNQTPELEVHALVMRQSDEAACLAWRHPYPLLTFPCLFEELAATSIEQARIQARRYWNNLEVLAPVRAA